MSGDDIVEWSLQLYEIVGEIEPARLHFLLNQFAAERIEWDKNKGIQNIFSGLKRVYYDVEANEYKLSRQ